MPKVQSQKKQLYSLARFWISIWHNSKIISMTVYLVKCKIDCGEDAKIRGIAPKIIKFESDVFGTEAQAQEFKQNFINKHQKKWGAWVDGRVYKKEI